MSFWNNPENNSIKTIIIVLVVIVLGYFVYRYVQSNSLGGSGRVINIYSPGSVNVVNPGTPAPAVAECDKANTFQTVDGNCVFIDGGCIVHESDSGAHTGACTGKEKPSPASVTGTGTSRGTSTTGTNPYPAMEKCKEENTWTQPGHNCVHISSDCVVTASNACTPSPTPTDFQQPS